MRTKDFSVNLDLCEELFIKLQFIEHSIRSIVNNYNYIMTITSANDGKHMKNSLHYSGKAIDIRSRDMANPTLVAYYLNIWLGSDFDVIFEGDHIHIEYDNK